MTEPIGMHSDRSIEAAVRRLSGSHGADKVSLIVGTIKSVDEDKATCEVYIQNDVVLPNVQLQAGVCDGLLVIPVKDSSVLVVTSLYSPPFIAQFSDVDKYYLQVGKSSFTVFNDAQSGEQSIVMNDGSYKGLVKVEDLVNHINTIEQDLNNLKTLLQTICTSTVNEPGNGAPSVFQIFMNAQLASYYAQQITETQVDDLQNKNITHGKV